jgi:hypothetical protein
VLWLCILYTKVRDRCTACVWRLISGRSVAWMDHWGEMVHNFLILILHCCELCFLKGSLGVIIITILEDHCRFHALPICDQIQDTQLDCLGRSPTPFPKYAGKTPSHLDRPDVLNIFRHGETETKCISKSNISGGNIARAGGRSEWRPDFPLYSASPRGRKMPSRVTVHY